MNEKQVAVIGAGLSGLVATKSCLEAGFKPTCFEKQPVVGGVWVYSDDQNRGEASAMYRGLMTNSSKEMMCYSDFPFPKDYPPYLLIKHVIKYLRDYSEHHQLEQYIRYETEVVNVSPVDQDNPTGQWNVTSRKIQQGNCVEEKTEVFDAVMVCSGLHSEKRMPKYPGMDKFKGKIIHSNAFRKGCDYAGQNVLVIGSSYSAGDVSVQCSQCANETYISIRHGCYVVSRRGPGGQPIDSVANRRYLSLVPEYIRAKALRRMVGSTMDHDSLGLASNRDILTENKIISDTIPDCILNGTLKVKVDVESFTENGVNFVDGTHNIEDIDTVICATGYYTTFPFLSPDIVDGRRLELYKHILSPKYTTLAFIGAVGSLGGALPIYELQSRWAAAVFSGSLRLPDLEYLKRDARKRVDALVELYGYPKIFALPVPYQDELAADIGAKPSLKLFLTDPALAKKVFFGPAYPPSYRLQGPHPWAGAREAIMNGWKNTITPTKTRQAPVRKKQSNKIFLPLLVASSLLVFILALVTIV